MNWNKMSVVPKQKNRPIVFLNMLNGKVTILSDVMESWNDALRCRSFQMKNTYDFWSYITPPK